MSVVPTDDQDVGLLVERDLGWEWSDHNLFAGTSQTLCLADPVIATNALRSHSNEGG